MTEFIFAYRSPTGYTPDDPEAAAAWRAWFAGFGPALRDIGRPVVDPVTIGTTSGDSTHLGGYSVVTAEGLDDALAMAKGCPLIGVGGGVEVGTLVNVPDELPASWVPWRSPASAGQFGRVTRQRPKTAQRAISPAAVGLNRQPPR